MIKKFKDFFSKRKETQQELDEMLDAAIRSNEYDTFVDYIKKGADINKHVDDPSYDTFSKLKYGTPLISCIFCKSKPKFIKHLIDCGVDLYDQPINIINLITNMYKKSDLPIHSYGSDFRDISNDGKEINNYILEKCPDYVEHWELKNDADKYNL